METIKNNFTQEQSLSRLNIPSTYSTYVCFDLGVVLRGYFSFSEKMKTINFLLKFAAKTPKLCLIIKPHPSYKEDLMDSPIFKSLPDNVYIIDKKTLPHHPINASDFLLTKFSAIGIDAMYLEKPIISLILDREKAFQAYQDAAEYVYDLAELDNLLDLIINNSEFRENWIKDYKVRSQKFINKIAPKLIEPAYDLAAKALDNYILEYANNNS